MIAYNGTVLRVGGSWLTPGDSPSPSVLPAKTMRFQFANTAFDPRDTYASGTDVPYTWTKVEDGIYDFHCDADYWTQYGTAANSNTIFNYMRTAGVQYPFNQTTLVGDWIDVIDSNMTGVISIPKWMHPFRKTIRYVTLKNTSDMTDGYNWGNSGGTQLRRISISDTSHMVDCSSMFRGCFRMEAIPEMDTSSCTSASYMFNNCSSITSIPLLNTARMTTVSYMFSFCTNVASGALAMYNQMSTQTTPPGSHARCFADCGSSTVTGTAELALIPSSWGGTGA